MNTSILISVLGGLLLGYAYSKIFIKRLEMQFLPNNQSKRTSPWWEVALIFFVSYTALVGACIALIYYCAINIPLFALALLCAFISQVYMYARSR